MGRLGGRVPTAAIQLHSPDFAPLGRLRLVICDIFSLREGVSDWRDLTSSTTSFFHLPAAVGYRKLMPLWSLVEALVYNV